VKINIIDFQGEKSQLFEIEKLPLPSPLFNGITLMGDASILIIYKVSTYIHRYEGEAQSNHFLISSLKIDNMQKSRESINFVSIY